MATDPKSCAGIAPFRAQVPFQAWPVIPTETNAIIACLADSFAESEWWTADALRRAQSRQFAALYATAREHVPY